MLGATRTIIALPSATLATPNTVLDTLPPPDVMTGSDAFMTPSRPGSLALGMGISVALPATLFGEAQAAVKKTAPQNPQTTNLLCQPVQNAKVTTEMVEQKDAPDEIPTWTQYALKAGGASLVAATTWIIYKRLFAVKKDSYINHFAGPNEGRRAIATGLYRGSVIAMGAVSASLILMILGVNIWSLISSLGLFSAVLAFATKDILSNLIGGIFIRADNYFEVGQLVRIGTSHKGRVTKIGSTKTELACVDDEGNKITLKLNNGEIYKMPVEIVTIDEDLVDSIQVGSWFSHGKDLTARVTGKNEYCLFWESRDANGHSQFGLIRHEDLNPKYFRNLGNTLHRMEISKTLWIETGDTVIIDDTSGTIQEITPKNVILRTGPGKTRSYPRNKLIDDASIEIVARAVDPLVNASEDIPPVHDEN